MKLSDSVWGLLCIVLGAAVLIHIQSFPAMPGQKYGPAVFPGLIAVGFCICGVLLVARGIKSKAALFEWMDWARSGPHVMQFFALIAAMVFYIFASEALGFLPSATIALFALFLLFGVPAKRAALIALVASLAIHFLFYKVMRVPLPWGILKDWAW